ncbi:phytanoyl-CoA dioxygenase family protein, partial [Candidatus Poribacteria bacterium]|nr:phytanoyl-CoA dioxygenase family protein [Candidatus Poribacteria bacterium]
MDMESEQIGLTNQQKSFYETNGYLVLESVFTQQECQRFVEHMEDLHNGKKELAGFFQQDKYGNRTFNQHLYDSSVMEFLIDTRLHQPLIACFGGEPEAIQ